MFGIREPPSHTHTHSAPFIKLHKSAFQAGSASPNKFFFHPFFLAPKKGCAKPLDRKAREQKEAVETEEPQVPVHGSKKKKNAEVLE